MIVAPQTAGAAPIFADTAVESGTTAFASGVLTGAPDAGGRFLSDAAPGTLFGSITAGFAGGLIDGPGVDLVIYDCCEGPDLFPRAAVAGPDADEFADVFVSTDGVLFTFLGAYGGPGQVSSFDLSGVYAGVVHFVRIVGTSLGDPADIDAFEGKYSAVAPEPAGLLLTAFGLVGFAAHHRRRQSR